jgi:hypothetical protein
MENCCEKMENRVVISHKNDVQVTQCSVCKRHHYELTVDPAKLFAKAVA